MKNQSDKKFSIIMILIMVLAIAGGALFVSRDISTPTSSQLSVNQNIRLVLEETSYDWREIGIGNGVVEKVFTIKNEGPDTLQLFNIATSCMCTTAQLSLGEKISPIFGMHTKSGYILDVPGGETAELTVVFDPAFHGPSGVGPINRQVTVETNDPINPKLSFMLTAMVRK